jgi:hypothetical protein
MKLAMGFVAGQFGDLIIQEPTVRAFLDQNPEYNLVLAAYEKFAVTLNFYNNYSNRIVGFYRYNKYNATPTPEERDSFMRDRKIDLFFSNMPFHKDFEWPKIRHQVIEFGHMYDIKVTDPQIRLPKPPNVPNFEKFIAVSLFPNNGEGVKSISFAKGQTIVDYCRSKGFGVLQLNRQPEPEFAGVARSNTDFYNAGVQMLGCRALIVGDTAMSWLASAFDIPTLGLYSVSYYPYCTTSKNWQPVNKNAIYLEAPNAEDIPNELIFQKIDELLQ